MPCSVEFDEVPPRGSLGSLAHSTPSCAGNTSRRQRFPFSRRALLVCIFVSFVCFVYLVGWLRRCDTGSTSCWCVSYLFVGVRLCLYCLFICLFVCLFGHRHTRWSGFLVVATSYNKPLATCRVSRSSRNFNKKCFSSLPPPISRLSFRCRLLFVGARCPSYGVA